MQAVCELMSVTFAQRQKDIKENPLHVSQLLEKYPFLKNKDIVRIINFCVTIIILAILLYSSRANSTINNLY